VEHRKTEVRQAAACGTAGDNAARFLRELRQLRSGAGLGHAELAARSHFPYDRIRAAERGPALPDLPVLAAYVQGCGATTDEWEERWRTLRGLPALSPLPTRPAGCSGLAAAGARLGSVGGAIGGSGGASIGPKVVSSDPSVVMAALDRVAEDMATTEEKLPGDTREAEAPTSYPGGAEDAPDVTAGGVAPAATPLTVVPRQARTGPATDTAPTQDAGPAADTGRTTGAAVPRQARAMPAVDALPTTDTGRTTGAAVPRQARAVPTTSAGSTVDAGPTVSVLPTVNGGRTTGAVVPRKPYVVPSVVIAPTVDAGPAADAVRTAGAVPVRTEPVTAGGALAFATGRRPLPPRALAALIVASVCVVAGFLLVGILMIFG
jgi:hypothetical protein